MIPTNFGAHPVDKVYWTLTLEILFYLMVFLILLAGLRAWIYRLVAVWLAILLAVNLLGIDTHGRSLLDDYYVLFAGGCVLAFIYRQGLTPLNTLLLAVAAVLSAYTAVERAQSLSVDYDFELNAAVVAAVIIAFYGACLILNTERIAAMRLPHARLIGALTYPLYLLHAHIGYMVLSRFANDGNKWLVLAALVVAMIVLSALIHEIAERRLRQHWAAMFNAVIGRPVRLLLVRNA
jgi:peptidoglycan/LPS O-acetylase OafA/YrhL